MWEISLVKNDFGAWSSSSTIYSIIASWPKPDEVLTQAEKLECQSSGQNNTCNSSISSFSSSKKKLS